MKKVLLHTFGCQMNTYDSEVAMGFLKQTGLSPAASEEEADLILFNTCSVRGHAEERVLGRLHALKTLKKEKPEIIIGLLGCMVEEHREKLFERFPHLDLLCGTRNLKDLPALLETIQGSRKPVSKIDREGLGIEYSEFQDRSSKIHAYLPIMTGCDKKCTYCIVPLTRGEEISVPMAAVLKQARGLVSKGVKHLTLLGQNVNSYGKKLPAGEDFTRLLRELNSLEELERISFVTSHPEDATEELFRTVADLPKISRRLHLPLQSGSSRILKRMKRGHTIENYIELTQRLRRYVPEISLTTDIIAGFPGETEEDFQATRRALEEIRFDGAFIFKYSPRPGTPASRWEDDVPLSEKKRRNQELLDLQNKITTENNLRLIGRCEAVLVEEPSPKDPAEWLARNIQEKKVVFRAEPCVAGKMVEVRFESLVGDTFRGSYYAA